MRFFLRAASGTNYPTNNDREGIIRGKSICTGGFGTSDDLVIDFNNDRRVADADADADADAADADAADAAADDDGGSIYSDGTPREGAPTVSQKLRGIFACIRRCMVFGGCGYPIGKLSKVNGKWQYDGPVKSHCLGGDDENEPPHEQKAEKQKSTTSGGSNAGHKRTSRTTRRESIRSHDIIGGAVVTAKRRRTQNNDDEDEYKDDEDESDDDDHDIKFIKKKKNKNKDKKDEVSILCVIIYISNSTYIYQI